MINPLAFLLKSHVNLKPRRKGRKTGGFTLIELLVAIILAALVITPLLGFMIDILSTDRKEQVKANSEQEIQAALEYISRDIEQAAYIYDADGVNAIKSRIPPGSGTLGDCDSSHCVPVLVMWKRRFVSKSEQLGNPSQTVGDVTDKNDAFVYSLVAYYLIKDNNSGTWSNSARITRFEIRDGIGVRDPVSGKFPINPDDGFQLFDLTAGSDISGVMNQWKATSLASYPDATKAYPTTSMNTLVDYIDDTPYNNPALPQLISTDKDQAILDCRDQQKGGTGGDTTDKTKPGAQRVPADLSSVVGLSSFYACVNSKANVARVYIRGNALARLDKNNHTANANNLTYFPTANARVAGRGSLSIEK